MARVSWVVFAVELIIYAGQLLLPVDPQDEGQFLTYPWLIAHGHVPYSDIWMSYPPTTYLLLVPLFKLGLPGLVCERALGFASRILYTLLVSRTLTGSWSTYSLVGGTAAFSLVFLASDTKPYPWLVAMPLVFLALRAMQERPGLSATWWLAASTFRFEFVVPGLVGLVTLGALQSSRRKAAWQAAVGLAFSFVLVFGALSAITSGSGFHDIFYDQLVTVQRARYITPGSLPFGPLGLPILVAMIAGPLGLILAGLVVRRPNIVATNLAVVSLLPHFFQEVNASHLFSFAALALPWSFVSLARLEDRAVPVRGALPHETEDVRAGQTSAARRFGDGVDRAVPTADRTDYRSAGRPGRVSLWILAVCGAAWPALIVLAYAVYLSPLSPLSPTPPSGLAGRIVTGRHTILAHDAAEARDDRAVVHFLDRRAKPGQTVFIAPQSLTSAYSRTDLYYALGLPVASRYLEVQPNVLTQPSAQRALIADLRTCTWVVLLHGGRWYSPQPGARPLRSEAFIRDHFHAVLDNVTYAVLKRAEGPMGPTGS